MASAVLTAFSFAFGPITEKAAVALNPVTYVDDT